MLIALEGTMETPVGRKCGNKHADWSPQNRSYYSCFTNRAEIELTLKRLTLQAELLLAKEMRPSLQLWMDFCPQPDRDPSWMLERDLPFRWNPLQLAAEVMRPSFDYVPTFVRGHSKIILG